MHFALTDEQRDLGRTTRQVLDGAARGNPLPPAWGARPRLDRDLWKRLAELGLLGLAVPEECGGAGAGVLELALAAEEFGAALPAVPFAATAAVSTVLTEAASRGAVVARQTLSAVAEGSVVAVPAWETFPEVGDGRHPGGLRLDGHQVTGTARAVPFGNEADVVLAMAVTDDGDCRLAHVRLDQGGVHRIPRPAFDVTEPLASVEFTAAEADILSEGPLAVATAAAIRTVLAAELVGVGRRALDDAVDYARTRQQFGRAIGSFQALKHMLADRHVQLDAARLLVHLAAATLDSGAGTADPDLEATTAADTALVSAGMAADAATADGLQAHGGIGFTWEQPAHVLLKRARARRSLLGSPERQLDALADRIFATALP